MDEKHIKAIIDIAKENLDTYEAELLSLGVLENITKLEYVEAWRRVNKLASELGELIERSEK